MRLHPAVTEEEALSWLLAQGGAAAGTQVSEEDLKQALAPFAAAMAALSAVVMPDEVEPLFP